MDTDSTQGTEGDYSLDKRVRDVAAGRRSIDVILECARFLTIGLMICCKIARNKEDGEDLFQLASIRLWKYVNTLNPENIPNEEAFWKWFRTLALNAYRSERRKKRIPIDDRPDEDFLIQDERVNLERTRQVHEFEEYCETLPQDLRQALQLWLTGFSFREIRECLGIIESHVTIRTWIRKALKDYLDRQ